MRIIKTLFILIILGVTGFGAYIYYDNFMGGDIELGYSCGADYGVCKSGLSCMPPEGAGTRYSTNPVTGNYFGTCSEESNRLGTDGERCGPDIILRCAVGYKCGKFPMELDSLCWRLHDFDDFPDELVEIDDKPYY